MLRLLREVGFAVTVAARVSARAVGVLVADCDRVPRMPRTHGALVQTVAAR